MELSNLWSWTKYRLFKGISSFANAKNWNNIMYIFICYLWIFSSIIYIISECECE